MYLWIYFIIIIRFFFNTLLYSDDVVSQKNQNNGQLDFAVSLSIFLISNIITSIVCHFIEYSDGIEEYFEQITEIMKEYNYLYAVNHFLNILNIKCSFFYLLKLYWFQVAFII